MIRAPIDTSLSVKNRRFSNIFSNTRIVPCACVATATAIDVRSAGNAGHGPSSIFGIAPPRSSRTASVWSGGHAHPVVAELELDAEPLERRHDRPKVVADD